MTRTSEYPGRRITSGNGMAAYRFEHEIPDPAYRELVPAIAEAYKAAEAVNAEGRELLNALIAAREAAPATKWGGKSDAPVPGPARGVKYADWEKGQAAIHEAEDALRAHERIAVRALTAYDRLVWEHAMKGGIKAIAAERANAAHARVLELKAELLAELTERERNWNLAGQPGVSSGEGVRRQIEHGNDYRQVELLLSRLVSFPKFDAVAPAPKKSPEEIKAEIDRQNAEAVAAVRARSKREGF